MKLLQQPLCQQPFRVKATWSEEWWPCCTHLLPPHAKTEDPWNSQEQRDLRKSLFSNDTLADACRLCTSHGSVGDASNGTAGDIHDDEYNKHTGEMLVLPKVMHYNFGNKCNLACLMCDEDSSTGFAKEFPDRVNGRTVGEKNLSHEEQFADIIRIQPDEVWVLGGEPFMYPSLPDVVEELLVLTDAKINIITAASIDLTRYKFWENVVLPNADRVCFTISCDGAPDTNAKVRVNLNPAVHKKNIDLLLANPEVTWRVHATITTANIDGVVDLVKWWMELNVKGLQTGLDLVIASQPHDMAIRNLPRNIREEYATKFRNLGRDHVTLQQIKPLYLWKDLFVDLRRLSSSLLSEVKPDNIYGANEHRIKVTQL